MVLKKECTAWIGWSDSEGKLPTFRMEGVEQRVASAVAEAAQNQNEEWGMMMDPAEIDVIAAFLKPSTVMLEWCVLSSAAHG